MIGQWFDEDLEAKFSISSISKSPTERNDIKFKITRTGEKLRKVDVVFTTEELGSNSLKSGKHFDKVNKVIVFNRSEEEKIGTVRSYNYDLPINKYFIVRIKIHDDYKTRETDSCSKNSKSYIKFLFFSCFLNNNVKNMILKIK